MAVPLALAKRPVCDGPCVALLVLRSQTKRKLNVNPRSVPFMSLYSVTHLRDKKGKLTKAFELRIMSGRVFEFQGKDMGDTVKWVTKLLSVLPRDNVAAVKIQSIWRMYGAKKELARRREVATGQRADVEKRCVCLGSVCVLEHAVLTRVLPQLRQALPHCQQGDHQDPGRRSWPHRTCQAPPYSQGT